MNFDEIRYKSERAIAKLAGVDDALEYGENLPIDHKMSGIGGGRGDRVRHLAVSSKMYRDNPVLAPLFLYAHEAQGMMEAGRQFFALDHEDAARTYHEGMQDLATNAQGKVLSQLSLLSPQEAEKLILNYPDPHKTLSMHEPTRPYQPSTDGPRERPVPREFDSLTMFQKAASIVERLRGSSDPDRYLQEQLEQQSSATRKRQGRGPIGSAAFDQSFGSFNRPKLGGE